jgi:hypothetical protein
LAVEGLRSGTRYGDVEIRLAVRDGRIAYVQRMVHETQKWPRESGPREYGRYDPIK